MNQDEFVAAIKLAVHDSAISNTKESLLSPPGRSPNPKDLKRSNWYKSISETDQMQVDEVIRQAVHSALFGFFCVLDGVRAVESDSDKGSLELRYKKGDYSELLNDHQKNDLHDIYQALVHDETSAGDTLSGTRQSPGWESKPPEEGG
jgi:hypothetical protein